MNKQTNLAKKLIFAALGAVAALFMANYALHYALAQADLTDWSDPKTVIIFDDRGDVTGECSADFKTEVDLIDARIKDDNDYLYLYWKISGGNGRTIKCSNSSFYAYIDGNNDGYWEYQAEYFDKNCSPDSDFTMLYNPGITIWPPPPIYRFTSSDYVLKENTLQLRVPLANMTLDDRVKIKMGIGPNFPGCTDPAEPIDYTFTGEASGPEICDDDIDNDSDRKIDCSDPDCDNESYCTQGLYTVKFKARIFTKPTVGKPSADANYNYWNAQIVVTEQISDPKGQIQDVLNQIGTSKLYLSGPADRVESPLYLDDLVEVEASFTYRAKDKLSIHSVKLIQENRVEVTGRVLPKEGDEARAKIRICSSDPDVDANEIYVYPPEKIISGDISESVLSQDDINKTGQELYDLVGGDCIILHHAKLQENQNHKYLEARPYGYELPEECEDACGPGCEPVELHFASVPEKLKIGEKFDPIAAIKNTGDEEITVDLAKMEFILNDTAELKDEKIRRKKTAEFFPSRTLGTSYIVHESTEYGFQPLNLYIRYTDTHENICEISKSQNIEITAPQAMPLTFEIKPTSFDLKELSNPEYGTKQIKMRARLGPNMDGAYLEKKTITFSIPCALSPADCTGEFEFTAPTHKDGYTFWRPANIRVSQSRIGQYTLYAAFAGEKGAYLGVSTSAVFQIIGQDGSLPDKDCSGDTQAKCEEAMECIFDTGEQCLAEIADLIPYLDKATAVALAANDLCEMSSRLDSGDPVGAAVTGILFSCDLGDNIADAVPVVGNAAGIVIDMIEGTIDCVEGIIYDQFKKCGGYLGCFNKIVDALTTEAAEKFSAMIMGFGSPVDVVVLDDQGLVLSEENRVFVLNEEDAKLVVILDPESLKDGYNIRIKGTADGVYGYKLAAIKNGQVVNREEEQNIQIKEDETVTYVPQFEPTEESKPFWRLTNILLVIGATLTSLIAAALLIWKFWLKKFKK